MRKALTLFFVLGGFMPAVHAATLSDAQITKVLLTIDQGEIDAANMAKKQSSNSDVKDYANSMIDVHQQHMTDTNQLASDNSITPATSAMSTNLQNDADKANKNLKKALRPKAFDQAYLAEQVQMHQKALKTLKNELLPNAQNPALRAHLEKTETVVEEHLQHARMLQTKVL